VELHAMDIEIEVTPLLQEAILVLAAKRTMLSEDKDAITTLVVGSSHGDYGFDPAYCEHSFNLCGRSQDLKHSYFLYRKAAEHCPTIQHVVIFYSVFSPGYVLEKVSSENDICPAINELFKLNLDYSDPKLIHLGERIKDKLDHVSITLDGRHGFMPTVGKGFFAESYGAIHRANEHLKLNNSTEANTFLIRTLLLARYLGHKPVIVIPPVRSDYKLATGGDGKLLYKSLLEIIFDYHIGCDIELLNLYDDPQFPDEDFGDFDHLHPLGNGAQRMSSMVSEVIKATPKSMQSPLLKANFKQPAAAIFHYQTKRPLA